MKKIFIFLTAILPGLCSQSHAQCDDIEFPFLCADGAVICSSSPDYNNGIPGQDLYPDGGPVKVPNGTFINWGIDSLFITNSCVDGDALADCVEDDFTAWTSLCPFNFFATNYEDPGLGSSEYLISPSLSNFPQGPDGDVEFGVTNLDINGNEIIPDGSSTDLNYTGDLESNQYAFVTCNSIPDGCEIPPNFDEIDLCTVVMHEIGHLFGLQDLGNNPCPNGCSDIGSAVMNGIIPGGCNEEDPNDCDLCYFQDLYCGDLPFSGVNAPNNGNSQEFVLGQCVPSPMSNYSDVSYSIGSPSVVIANLYDVLGHPVEHIFSGGEQNGTYSLHIDGSRLADGTYFLRVSAEGQVKTVRVVKEN